MSIRHVDILHRIQPLLLLAFLALSLPVAVPTALAQAVPPNLVLNVHETTGVARTGEVIRSGVPLPRALGLRDTAGLTLVDGQSVPVPAEFQILARWNAGRSESTSPIQWLLVTFPASVAANASASFRVVMDGSAGPNPAPAASVSVSRHGDQYIIDTGAATFRVGGTATALFDEIRLADGTRLASAGTMTARAGASDTLHTVTRRISLEHAGPLTAILVVEGAYDLPNLGGGGLGSSRRYLFTAGSPTVLVRHSIAWEGSLCNLELTCAGTVNGLLVERVRDTLSLDLASPRAVTAVGAFTAAALQESLPDGAEAWVRQRLRDSRTAAPAFDLQVGPSGLTGANADGALLAVGTGQGAVAVALNRMHRFEPQALRLLADGRIAIDLADDKVWLGQHQGLYANFAVSALAASPSRAELDREIWAPLNHPLRAWPTTAWLSASEALDELPVGPLPAGVADYHRLVPEILEETLAKVDEKGLNGLMTFGEYPRYWGNALSGDGEIQCNGNDPTPGESWDDSYWCATWTDYHNTLTVAPYWAMRSGETRWLDEIAFPGAWRMLHTQIEQCAPGDSWFYCGQSPAGYGGYRYDFNSSHAYFENLMLYYWLTGDYTVVETLKRGAGTMRDFLCARRPAQSCLADDPPSNEWAQMTGRGAMQWASVFRFLGLSSDDAGFLEDYRSTLARAVTQYYVAPEQGGVRYGFWLGCPVDRAQPCATPAGGDDTTDQLWMASLYDMNLLYRLQRDSNDAPLGNPAVAPSQVIAAWARTLSDYGATVSGDGTATGQWPNALYFTWSGNRIGGTLTGVRPNTDVGDPYLWNTGKASLSATMLRAGAQTGDPALWQMGEALTRLGLESSRYEFAPLGKVQGLYLARLHAAVARLAEAAADPAATDTDGDGLYDNWESVNGFDPLNPADGWLDRDGDGLAQYREFLAGADPNLRDTDQDGLPDGWDPAPLQQEEENACTGSPNAALSSASFGDGVVATCRADTLLLVGSPPPGGVTAQPGATLGLVGRTVILQPDTRLMAGAKVYILAREHLPP